MSSKNGRHMNTFFTRIRRANTKIPWALPHLPAKEGVKRRFAANIAKNRGVERAFGHKDAKEITGVPLFWRQDCLQIGGYTTFGASCLPVRRRVGPAVLAMEMCIHADVLVVGCASRLEQSLQGVKARRSGLCTAGSGIFPEILTKGRYVPYTAFAAVNQQRAPRLGVAPCELECLCGQRNTALSQPARLRR